MGTDNKPDHSANSGAQTDASGKAPTYQDVLDEALEETFPASDPIATGAAMRPRQKITTEKNADDWQLAPGSSVETITPQPAPDNTGGAPSSASASDVATGANARSTSADLPAKDANAPKTK